MVVNLVTTTKLEKDRIDKLKNLSPDEATEYIESLVLEMYKGFHDGIIDVDFDNAAIIDKLNEFETICENETNYNNIDAVILDRKFRYLATAYETAFYIKGNNAADSSFNIKFTLDLLELETLYNDLKVILIMYYENYSNYGFMEDLLMDLSDDGLIIDADIHEKYVYSVKYGFNKKLMKYLNISIKVRVKLLLSELDRMDKLYLTDESVEAYVDDVIDDIHDAIKSIYTNRGEFEIEACKQTGYINALLSGAENTKNDTIEKSEKYLDVKDKILDLINGNGFEKLSGESFDDYKKRNPDDDVDFDEFMKKEPKYDVRNAKFIYPENRDYYEF